MNTNGVAKHYSRLTADERFRLILAAVSRGDDAEKNRLINAGQRIQQTISDVVPYLHAFIDIQNSTYIELLALAAQYHDFNARTGKLLGESIVAARTRKKTNSPSPPKGQSHDEDAVEYPAWHCTWRAAYGLGFVLKVKMDGWRLFCEGLQASPQLMWEQPNLPGLLRIIIAVAMAKSGQAFPSASEMARWMDEVHPLEDRKRTEANVKMPAMIAAELEAEFRERVRFWGG